MKDIFSKWPLYEHVTSSFKEVLEDKHRYRRIMPAVVEHEEVFMKTLGVQSDIVQKEMYRIEGQGMVLRPEGTAGTMRALLTDPSVNAAQLTKAWYWGPMFRYERPQAGRQR